MMGGQGFLDFLASFGAGTAGGVFAGLFGIGGGIVLVPLLALMLGIGQHQAQGLSLAALLFPNSLPAVLHFRRRGFPFYWKLALAMVAAFVPGIWLGARLANSISPRALQVGFAGFLVLLAIKTLCQKAPDQCASALEPEWWKGLPLGLFGGICGGLLGIGGGVVMIPLMVLLLKLSQHQAQLTSLLVMLPPVGLPAVFVYFGGASNPIPWLLMIGLALGFQCGAFLGARIATRISAKLLQRGFVLLMFLLALLLMARHPVSPSSREGRMAQDVYLQRR